MISSFLSIFYKSEMAGVEPEAKAEGIKNLEKESSQRKIHCMLLGAPGAGKSSLVNSLTRMYGEYSPKRKYPYIPTARTQRMDGHTMMREPVVLTDTLTIVDNRGWHDWGNKAALKELTAQIHGTRSYDEDVTWNVTGNTSVAGKAPSIPRVVSDKIDCIAIVINGNGGIGAIENLDKLIETCRKNTRRRPSFVITHRDQMSAEEIENITSTLENDYDVEPEKIVVIRNVTTRNDMLDAGSKSYLTAFMKAWVSDGEAGAAFHTRREEQLKVEENLEMVEKVKEVSLGKVALESDRQAEAKIQLEIETQKQKKLAELSIKAREIQQENDDYLHVVNKNHIEKTNNVRLENTKSFHEVDKKCLKEYWGRKT